MPSVHVILIPFNNPERTKVRWHRDILPGLELLGFPYCVSVIDNSERLNADLQELFGQDYVWNEGKNLQYGPSMNLAVQRHDSDYCLYVCTAHGRMLNPLWVGDLIFPFSTDAKIGMTGYLMGSNSPEGVVHHCGPGSEWIKEAYYFDEGVKQHVQGGVFAARTEALRQCPYHDVAAHLYSDHLVSWALLKTGWKLHNVPTIESVWRETVRNTHGLHYIHDLSEE